MPRGHNCRPDAVIIGLPADRAGSPGRPRAVEQQHPQAGVALCGDRAEAQHRASGALPWGEPQLGREVTPGGGAVDVADYLAERRGREQRDSGHHRQQVDGGHLLD